MNLFKQEDTIIALATPQGKSALAVLRISGNNALKAVSSVFFNVNHKNIDIKNRKIHEGYICDGDENIDEVVVSYMQKPNSSTGEDVVEITTHGNQIIIQSIIELLLKNGVRLADRGEFSYRAFINNKMDLTEAESVNTLINSSTKKAVQLSLNTLQGCFSNEIKKIKEQMTQLYAYLEVSLDYPEEEIDFLTREQKIQRLKDIISQIENLSYSYTLNKNIIDGIQIAIVGKPNAGKSSILNSILGYGRAIVTDIAGTTTDTIKETIEYKGFSFSVTDTAGLRNHSVNAIEQIGQERTKNSIETSDIILFVLDGSRPFDKDDESVLNLLKQRIDDTLIVINKSDLNKKISIDNLQQTYNDNQIIEYSCVDKKNINLLLEKIYNICGLHDKINNSSMLINTRQYNLLCKLKNELEETLSVIIKADQDEIVSFKAQECLKIINEILGIDVKEDILTSIFSKFCIGK